MRYIQTALLLIVVLVVSGCVYPSTYFAPKAPLPGDYVQRTVVDIKRQNLSINVYSYVSSESLSIYINGGEGQKTKLNIDASKIKVERKDIGKTYTANNYRYLKYIDGELRPVDNRDLRDSILQVFFDPKAASGNSFIVHLPLAKYGIEQITFTKVTKIKAITIN